MEPCPVGRRATQVQPAKMSRHGDLPGWAAPRRPGAR